MKKLFIALFVVLIILAVSLVGCNATREPNIDEDINGETEQQKESYPDIGYISDRSINRDDENSRFYFLFSFKDDNKQYVKCPATVKMRIVNDAGETVYSKTVEVGYDDFGTWHNAYNEWLAASVYINDSEIAAGSVNKGTFYYKVTAADGSNFDEFSLTIEKGLPLEKYNGEATLSSIPEIVDICEKLANYGDSTKERYLVEGYISEITNTTYGNFYIVDNDGNSLFIYGLYSEDGETRYDDMASAPQVGDKVTLWGALKNYNGAEMVDAWLINVGGGLSPNGCEEHVEEIIEGYPATCTEDGLTDGLKCKVCHQILTQQEKIEKTGHNFSTATCLDLSKCENCGLEQGEIGDHTYENGFCSICGYRDRSYVYEIGFGETWVVDGLFEFSIDTVFGHELCNKYGSGYDGMSCVIVKYRYKNTGASYLFFDEYDIDIYDQEGMKGKIYPCTHTTDAESCIIGTQCLASGAYAIHNESSSIVLMVQGSVNGETYKGRFVIESLHEHSFVEATCLTPKTCTECGYVEGKVGSHNYVDGFCTVCEKEDPDYVPVYGLGDTFLFKKTGGEEFEITIGSSYSFVTASYRYGEHNGKTAVAIPVTVKNIGGSSANILVNYSVYDSHGGETDILRNYFSDEKQVTSSILAGASVSGAIHILYSGDGRYAIKFSSWGEEVLVEIYVSQNGNSDNDIDTSGGYLGKGIPKVEDVFPGIACSEVKTGVTEVGYNIFYQYNNVSLGAFNEYCEYIEEKGASLVNDTSVPVAGCYMKEYEMNGQTIHYAYFEGEDNLLTVNFYDLASLPE